MARTKHPAKLREAESYKHPDSTSPMRPDVGTQAQFKKKKAPVTYRYDSSLSPALDWDGQNSARELGEQQLSVISSQLSEIRQLVAQGSLSSPAVLPAVEKPQGQKTDLALQKPVALVFGPENGAVSEKLVYEAAREAHVKGYTHLYMIGFAIQPHGRELVEKCLEVVGILATYVQATPDIMMGDLLKNMRSSQIFSVCGLPEVEIRRTVAPVSSRATGGGDTAATAKYEVELLGLDVFDPATMEPYHRRGEEVPAWFLDTDYNGLCFHVSQAFFPRTGAWDSLKKALKGEYEESVWDHLAGTVSTAFEAGQHGQVAVKVIDDRGNELLVVKSLGEGQK